MTLLRASLLLLVFLPIHGLRAETVNVAVAANFAAAMRELVTAFEWESEHQVVVSSGSSGRLYAQIVNGAPFQLFFSADQEKPEALVDGGYAVADSRFTYALGSLVLWSADPDMPVVNAEAMKRQQGIRIAMANPRLAPYGLAAAQVLDSLEQQGIDTGNRVMGENITQAYQFVETGNAALGFVALSQVIEGGEIRKGAGWMIPPDLYDPIRQDAVLLKRAEKNNAAREFLTFIRGNNGKKIIVSYGYNTDSE